jgi:hypothetical protein
MARKTIRVSDQSGDEIPDGKGAVVRITFNDARKGVRELDVTDAGAERLGGRAVARRGRRPKASATPSLHVGSRGRNTSVFLDRSRANGTLDIAAKV